MPFKFTKDLQAWSPVISFQITTMPERDQSIHICLQRYPFHLRCQIVASSVDTKSEISKAEAGHRIFMRPVTSRQVCNVLCSTNSLLLDRTVMPATPLRTRIRSSSEERSCFFSRGCCSVGVDIPSYCNSLCRFELQHVTSHVDIMLSQFKHTLSPSR